MTIHNTSVSMHTWRTRREERVGCPHMVVGRLTDCNRRAAISWCWWTSVKRIFHLLEQVFLCLSFLRKIRAAILPI